MKIRTGDTVVVISGKDKGKSGTVQRVLTENGKVVVSGINMHTRHVKKTTQEAGRKITFEAAFHIGKVMIIDPKTGKPSRVGFQMKDGKKIRLSKKSGVEVVKAKAKMEKKKTTKGTPTSASLEAPAGKKEVEAKKATTVKEVAPGLSGAEKQPFWKRMKFGSAAIDAEVPVQPNMDKDHSIPAQELHRKGGRGT